MEQHLIDATDQPMGRLASKIATLLQGKTDPSYDPRLASKMRVVVKNAKAMVVTGKKYTDKLYHHHTGYMGHLRTKKYRDAFLKNPSEVLRSAIYNMLPKNRIRRVRLQHLTIHDGEN